MAIQTRRGAYNKFDPRKLVSGEMATVTEGDPHAEDGKAVYMCFTPGDVKRMATYEDMVESVDAAAGDAIDQHLDERVDPVLTQCQKISTNMSKAIESSKTATEAANTAAQSAETASTAAATAAKEASNSADKCKALLDETHIAAIDTAVQKSLMVGDIEGDTTGTLASDLPEVTSPGDDNNIILSAGNTIKRFKWSNLLTAIKNKLLTWTYDKLTTQDKTLPGAVNELNTNINTIGKTAKFYAGGNFYVGGSSDYTGLALGSSDRNNIDGLKFIGAADYKHYYTFPQGTYLVTINLFATFDASASNILGAALKIDVDDVTVSNPWFRMVNCWQSIIYPIIVTGSKLKVTMYTDRTIEISNNSAVSFIDFVRLA